MLVDMAVLFRQYPTAPDSIRQHPTVRQSDRSDSVRQCPTGRERGVSPTVRQCPTGESDRVRQSPTVRQSDSVRQCPTESDSPTEESDRSDSSDSHGSTVGAEATRRGGSRGTTGHTRHRHTQHGRPAARVCMWPRHPLLSQAIKMKFGRAAQRPPRGGSRPRRTRQKAPKTEAPRMRRPPAPWPQPGARGRG